MDALVEASIRQADALERVANALAEICQELVALRQLVEEIAPQDSAGRRHLAVHTSEGY